MRLKKSTMRPSTSRHEWWGVRNLENVGTPGHFYNEQIRWLMRGLRLPKKDLMPHAIFSTGMTIACFMSGLVCLGFLERGQAIKEVRISKPANFIRSDPFTGSGFMEMWRQVGARNLSRWSSDWMWTNARDGYIHWFDLVHSDNAKYLETYSMELSNGNQCPRLPRVP